MTDSRRLFEHACALQSAGDLAGAAQGYAEVLALTPADATALNNLGNVMLDLGHGGEAEQCFRHALALAPDSADFRYNLARLLHLAGRADEALAEYERAATLAPALQQAVYNRAALLYATGRLDAAIVAYRDLVARFPDHVHGWNNLGKALRERGESDGAVAAFDVAHRLAPDDAEIASNRLFAMLHSENVDAATMTAAQKEYRRALEEAPALGRQAFANEPEPQRRLRIGFVSPDLGDHPVGRFLEPLFDHWDAAAAELICYPTYLRDDGLARRLRQRCALWRPLAGLADAAAAEAIRRDGIDVLVDLAGHTAGNRLPLFARKPAPVQLTWLGYLGSSGLAATDARLSDARCDPPELAARWHREDILAIEGCQWCYRPPAEAPEVSPWPEGGKVTIGSFNNVAKLSPAILAAWGEILAATDADLLVAGAPAGEARARVVRLLGERGVAGDRVSFLERLPAGEYFRQIGRVHFALDSYPYAGGTTTCDALWMGVPTVSWAGERSCSRSGASLLATVGLSDWVASSKAEYVAIGRKWAGNPAQLAPLRAGLRARMRASPLLDEAGFARHWLAAVRAAWCRWCAGNRKTK